MTGDLIVLVPDKDTEETLKAVLVRTESLRIRRIRFGTLVHPYKDSGCFSTGVELLRTQLSTWAHGLVVFDRAWEGAPSTNPADLEHKVQGELDLMRPGWGRCFVIDPELEIWLFSDSPHVDEALGWSGRSPSLREWLRQRGQWPEGSLKPPDPERAFREAMYKVRIPAAASVFAGVARRVSLTRCQDRAFRGLVHQLQAWFPETGQP